MAGITASIELRPWLSLRDDEIKRDRLFEKQVVIQSAGPVSGSARMINKNWFPERFQAVGDAIGGSVKLIQLGQKTDPPIQGALDLRGENHFARIGGHPGGQ